MRLVIGMTGATGAILGIRVLEVLRDMGVETHLVLSHWARATIELETDRSVSEVRALAAHVHAANDQAAPVSSGSFRTDGMIVVPASMKTVAAIRTGYGDGLIARAADVTIKERRKLVLVPRETPLSEIHLDNLLALARMGVQIVPPMPAFYHRPTSVADLVDQTVARILDQVGLDLPGALRWTGTRALREGIHVSAL
ncbi:UbiX family flavin prenyltransferase [Amycolatopsis saalfeldensis]|uniref:Flavin prenyltransferase UbiX n=1 Tax=Amycolatopsis saalfeldensis TaxID=394193 RepID=A0A1H8YP19_9PSEU|nr:UbiX family flavin prenyltransferase [Amycolatopsis saalfeldensis]SEP53899.1 4-hydroxy-3-polyprenylbenzoate decarboxylase [Amycolatopsis saalfeldensis]